MHCGAVDYQSSYEHAISDLAQRSLIIVCKYCGESRVEKKNFFLVNYKCVGPSIISMRCLLYFREIIEICFYFLESHIYV